MILRCLYLTRDGSEVKAGKLEGLPGFLVPDNYGGHALFAVDGKAVPCANIHTVKLDVAWANKLVGCDDDLRKGFADLSSVVAGIAINGAALADVVAKLAGVVGEIQGKDI